MTFGEEDLSIAGFKTNPLSRTTMRPSGSIQTSVLVSPGFFKLAKENNIKFSEALRIGLSLIFAERNIGEYDNNLNLVRKMNFFRTQAEQALLKIEELEKEKNGRSD